MSAANRGTTEPSSIFEQLQQQIVKALQTGDAMGANRMALDFLRRKPDDENALILLGLSLRQQERFLDAVWPYRRLIELFPKAALHWNNLGTALRESGNVEEAVQAYLRSIELDPGQYETRMNLGYLLMEDGMYSRALDQYRCAHSIAPEEPDAGVFAAQMSFTLEGRRDAAEELILPWRTWSNISDDLRFELAALLVSLGRAEDGRELLENLIGDQPENYRAIAQLAVTYERINRLEDARLMLGRLPAPDRITDSSLLFEINSARVVVALRENPAVARSLLEEMIATAEH